MTSFIFLAFALSLVHFFTMEDELNEGDVSFC